MRKTIVFTSVIVTIIFLTGYTCVAAEDSTQKVLIDAIIGGGTGAIAAGATGGKVGIGALIGAGTGAVGGALLDVISRPTYSNSMVYYPASHSKVYYPAVRRNVNRISFKKGLSDREIYLLGYEKGYQEGFSAGFKQHIKKGIH